MARGLCENFALCFSSALFYFSLDSICFSLFEFSRQFVSSLWAINSTMYHVELKFFTDHRHWWFTKRRKVQKYFPRDLFLEIFLTTASLDTIWIRRPLLKIVCCQKVNGAKKTTKLPKNQRNCRKINKINSKHKKLRHERKTIETFQMLIDEEKLWNAVENI